MQNRPRTPDRASSATLLSLYLYITLYIYICNYSIHSPIYIYSICTSMQTPAQTLDTQHKPKNSLSAHSLPVKKPNNSLSAVNLLSCVIRCCDLTPRPGDPATVPKMPISGRVQKPADPLRRAVFRCFRALLIFPPLFIPALFRSSRVFSALYFAVWAIFSGAPGI